MENYITHFCYEIENFYEHNKTILKNYSVFQIKIIFHKFLYVLQNHLKKARLRHFTNIFYEYSRILI